MGNIRKSSAIISAEEILKNERFYLGERAAQFMKRSLKTYYTELELAEIYKDYNVVLSLRKKPKK